MKVFNSLEVLGLPTDIFNLKIKIFIMVLRSLNLPK